MNALVKTLKTVNFMSGKADSMAEIKRHRKQAELASRLATPKGNVERRRFRVGRNFDFCQCFPARIYRFTK